MKAKKSQLPIIESTIQESVCRLLEALPPISKLSKKEARDIIARYTAVLEGNFIAWMTAAHIASASKIGRLITEENLKEELGDNHPGMLRKFAIAAKAEPTHVDYMIVHGGVEAVRKSVGQLSGLKNLISMAFFESSIAAFMPYLADLAHKQGSKEFQYTDVHGEVDISHTAELYRAIRAELAETKESLKTLTPSFEGVRKLTALIQTIIHGAI